VHTAAVLTPSRRATSACDTDAANNSAAANLRCSARSRAALDHPLVMPARLPSPTPVNQTAKDL
jgi:hypothetical protein